MQTIAIANRKGGVAKTTSTVNLSAELAARGLRVLVCDLDPQATLTLVAGHVPDSVPDEETALAALLPELVPGRGGLCIPTPWGADIMRANPTLANAEVALTAGDAAGPHQRLARALKAMSDNYDVVLVDSPPSLGKLVLNALCAADHVLVPVACDFASVGGLDRLFELVNQLRTYETPDLEVLGVFATQVRRTLHARETLELLHKLCGQEMLKTSVPQAVAIQDAQAQNQAVRAYQPQSPGALAYAALADEVMARMQMPTALAA